MEKFQGLDPKPHELIQIRLKDALLLSLRTGPTSVEKDGEEFGLGVKGLSNAEIAGFPRNLLR